MKPNGMLVDSRPTQLSPVLQATVVRMYGRAVLEDTIVEKISYYSDGLKVKGYIARPRRAGVYPVLIWNRGGSGNDGALTDLTAHLILASTAVWGYVVLATQYRGNDGGEGEEDWGGDDVRDALHLIDLAKQMPECDPGRIAVEGASRGGITTYRLLTMYPDFKCAITHAATSDIFALTDARDDFRRFMKRKFGGGLQVEYDVALRLRSAVYFADRFPKQVPLLMMHGTADERIPVEQSLELDRLLTQHGVPHKLVLIEGGQHIALKDGSYKEIDGYRKEWLKTYLG